jgi:type IV pilus assembly protein PilY1
VGSTGAGAGVAAASGVSPGTSDFAIDVTSLNTNTTSLDSTKVLWEVGSKLPDAASSAFSEMGYVLSDVQVGPTMDGSWVAIFGNGFESKSCKAQLFIVNLATGALIKKLDTGAGNCSTAKNGLGGARLVRKYKALDPSTTDDNRIIGVYAGDLQGNMWKFDLSSASVSDWKVDLGGDPLFAAGASQPITAPPTVIDLKDPNVWADGKNNQPTKNGYMVVFGTGKLLETSDLTIPAGYQQALYGVWDSNAMGASSTATGAARVTSSVLTAQTIGGTATVVGNNSYFASSKNSVDYAGGKKGWYLNFPNSGQRLVYPIDTLAYHYVGVDTISPAGLTLNACVSGSGGAGYFYVMEALSGAAPTENVLGIPDVNGVQTSLDGRNVALKVDDAAQYVYKILTPESDPVATVAINKPVVTTPAKKIRKWRQLFMR